MRAQPYSKGMRYGDKPADHPRQGFVRMSQAAVMLGLDAISIRALLELDFLEGYSVGTHTWVRIDEATTRETLEKKLFDDAAAIRTLEGFEQFKKRSRALQKHYDRKIPSTIVDAAFRFMLDEGLTPTSPRFFGLVGGPRPIAQEIFLREIEKRGLTGNKINARRFGGKGKAEDETILMSRLSEAARSAPGTFLDPEAAKYFKKPPLSYFSRLVAIRSQALLDVLASTIFFAHAQGVRPTDLKEVMAAMTNLDAALQGEDLRKPVDVREVLDRILGPEFGRTKAIGYPRPNVVKRYDWMLRKFEEIVDEAAVVGREGEFAELRLSKAAGHANLMTAVLESLRVSHDQGSIDRGVRIQKMLDHPEEFQLVGRTRLDEHLEILRQVDAKIDKVIARGKPLLEPLAFKVTYETRLETEGLRKFTQSLLLEIWPWSMLIDRIRDEMRKTALNVRFFANGAQAPTEGREAYAVRFLGIAPSVPGGPTQMPVVVEAARSHLLDRTASLSAKHMRDREAAIARLGFDLANWRTAAGLPGFAWRENAVKREAVRMLDFVLLPIREAALGMMFANAAVEVMLDSGCRWFEASQTQTDMAKWTDKDDDVIGQTIWTFEAVPKMKGELGEFHILDETMTRLMNLAEKTSERWHQGGPVPLTRGTIDQTARGMTPAPYIFHVRQDRMPHDLLSILFRLLYLGWFGLKGHDVRHLFNNIAREAKVPAIERMRMMKHSQEATNETYGRQTPIQRRSERTAHQRFLHDRRLKLEQAADAPASAEVARIQKEIRRQQALLEFHLREGDDRGSEAVELEIQELAKRLAVANAVASGASDVIDVDSI